uniref:hypothetical protein n=1 Tax=Acetatifactor sp. TaxID=1872090 RepID=UPI004056CBDE
MHIAICDDNVADRHQMERLMKRESDKRSATTGILYIDSFGNGNALLANPMRYDAYYIDVCKTDGITGIDITNKLLQAGTQAPVILCCSELNYREHSFPDNVRFLDKPIKPEELSDTLNYALEIKAEAVPQIELREDKETYYVTEPDILYAVEDGLYLIVTLTDGRKIRIMTDIANFFDQLENFPTFLAPSAKAIINGRHI